MFSPNEGSVDRGLRIILGITLMGLGFGGVITGGTGLLIGFLGLIPLVTGVAGWCPAYALLGINTLGRKGKATP